MLFLALFHIVVMEKQTRLPFPLNRENQGLLSLHLIHFSENILLLNAFSCRAIFPQFKLLINSSFSSTPDYNLFLISISPCTHCNSRRECLLILPSGNIASSKLCCLHLVLSAPSPSIALPRCPSESSCTHFCKALSHYSNSIC